MKVHKLYIYGLYFLAIMGQMAVNSNDESLSGGT